MTTGPYPLAVILCIAIPLASILLICLLVLFILAFRFSCIVERLHYPYVVKDMSISEKVRGDFGSRSFHSIYHSQNRSSRPSKSRRKRTFINALCCIAPSTYNLPSSYPEPISKSKEGVDHGEGVTNANSNALSDNSNRNSQNEIDDETNRRESHSNLDHESFENVNRSPRSSTGVDQGHSKFTYSEGNALGVYLKDDNYLANKSYMRDSEPPKLGSLGLKDTATLNLDGHVRLSTINDTITTTLPNSPLEVNGPVGSSQVRHSTQECDVHNLSTPPAQSFQSFVKQENTDHPNKQGFTAPSSQTKENSEDLCHKQDVEELIPPVKSALRKKSGPYDSQQFITIGIKRDISTPQNVNKSLNPFENQAIEKPQVSDPKTSTTIHHAASHTLSNTPMLTPLESFGQLAQPFSQTTSHRSVSSIEKSQTPKSPFVNPKNPFNHKNRYLRDHDRSTYTASPHRLLSPKEIPTNDSEQDSQLQKRSNPSFASEFLQWSPVGYYYYQRQQRSQQNIGLETNQVNQDLRQEPTQSRMVFKGLSKDFSIPKISSSEFKFQPDQPSSAHPNLQLQDTRKDIESSDHQTIDPHSKGAYNSLHTRQLSRPRIEQTNLDLTGTNKQSNSLSPSIAQHNFTSDRGAHDNNMDHHTQMIAAGQSREKIRRGDERIGRIQVEQEMNAVASFAGSVIEPENNDTIQVSNNRADPSLSNESAWVKTTHDDSLSSQIPTPTDSITQPVAFQQKTGDVPVNSEVNYGDFNRLSENHNKIDSANDKQDEANHEFLNQRISISQYQATNQSRSSSLTSGLTGTMNKKSQLPNEASEDLECYPHPSQNEYFENIKCPDALKISGSIRNIASLKEPVTPRSPGYQPGQNTLPNQTSTISYPASYDNKNKNASSRGQKGSDVLVRRLSTFAYGNYMSSEHKYGGSGSNAKPKIDKELLINKPLPSTPFLKEEGVLYNLRGAMHTAVIAYAAQLSDELDLEPGDLVRVYEVFDDGWCLAKIAQSSKSMDGRNNRGVCPRSCLSK